MGKAYSQDLRLRVLAAIDSGMSKMTVHMTFRISRSTIDDWLAFRSAQGHVRPNVSVQRGPQPAIPDLDVFKAFAHRHNGCTLAQMAQAWEHETGRKLSRNTFSLALKKSGWTRKKSAWPTPNAMQPSEQLFSSS
jgi:transposase